MANLTLFNSLSNSHVPRHQCSQSARIDGNQYRFYMIKLIINERASILVITKYLKSPIVQMVVSPILMNKPMRWIHVPLASCPLLFCRESSCTHNNVRFDKCNWSNSISLQLILQFYPFVQLHNVNIISYFLSLTCINVHLSISPNTQSGPHNPILAPYRISCYYCTIH